MRMKKAMIFAFFILSLFSIQSLTCMTDLPFYQLLTAIEDDNPENTQHILNEYPHLIKTTINNPKSKCHGWNPLHLAVYNGNIIIVKALLNAIPEDQRADFITIPINNPGEMYHNWTTFHLAIAILPQIDVIEILLKTGAQFPKELTNNFKSYKDVPIPPNGPSHSSEYKALIYQLLQSHGQLPE